MLLYCLVDFIPVPENHATIEIGERRWWLMEEEIDASQPRPSDFICISYTWGTGREPNPLDPFYMLSSWTLPVLSAAMSCRPECHRFWIDALCVPVEQEAKRFTLASMGFIYSMAKEVMVVLSEACQTIIQQMTASDKIDQAALDSLEKEAWINRAWTYQEVVNSWTLSFTCLSPATGELNKMTVVQGAEFLNRIGYTLSRLPSTDLQKHQAYPSLSAFEDLIADWLTADYQERSALQVMANMDRRVQERAEDHYYAMIGAMTAELASLSMDVDACEEFMSVCERKGDYSYIFSPAARSEDKSRRWRPKSGGNLPTPLPWHCWGERQPGHWEEGVFYLDEMVVLEPGPLGEASKKFVTGWLAAASEPGWEDMTLDQTILKCLKRMGFKGDSESVQSSAGIFFPCERIQPPEIVTILASAALRWTFGAPALARLERNEGTSFISGVFVGVVDRSSASIVRME